MAFLVHCINFSSVLSGSSLSSLHLSLWWLSLCINLSWPWDGQIFGHTSFWCLCEDVLDDRLSKADCSSWCRWVISNRLKTWEAGPLQRKREFLLPDCYKLDLHYWFSWSSGLKVWTRATSLAFLSLLFAANRLWDFSATTILSAISL